MSSGEDLTPAIERRRLLKAAVAVGTGTAMWASPAIQSIGSVPVSAQSGLPDGTAILTRAQGTWTASVSGVVVSVDIDGGGSPEFTVTTSPAGCLIESVASSCNFTGGLGTQSATFSGCGNGSTVTLNVSC